MTYSESKGKQPIDWNAFLNKEMKDVTWDEMGRMNDAADDWVTCACGNECDIIPRYKTQAQHGMKGEPKDIVLMRLGVDFCQAVNSMDNNHGLDLREYNQEKRRAIYTLHQIEKRSAEIINEIKNK